MALSAYALKLRKYLGIYNITAKNYNSRISGAVLYENLYNPGRFEDNFGDRKPIASTKGLFKTALAELVAANY